MGILGTIVAVFVLGLFGLMIALQVVIQRRSRAMLGAPVPPLPGSTGQRVTRAKHSLLYFFSPSCGACRAITPKVRELEKTNANVFAVDITRDLELARALKVMATPSTIEITDGTVSGFHIGQIPEAVLARFRGALT